MRRGREAGAFKERWGDNEGAESSLHGRLKASEETRRMQRGRNLQGEIGRWGGGGE